MNLLRFAAALLVLTPFGSAHAEKNVETFVGRAVDASGRVAYIERHKVVYNHDTVVESKTLYFDGQNRPIGELVSDYSAGAQFGSYQFVDKRADYRDGATVLDDAILLFRDDEADNADVRKSTLPRRNDQIVGQGFHHFIRTNLDAIAAGRILHVKLVLPSRLDEYAFRIRCLEVDGDQATIRLEIDNWLLRLFAPHVDAVYDVRTRQLVRYEGISNLVSATGDYKKVTITYSYD